MYHVSNNIWLIFYHASPVRFGFAFLGLLKHNKIRNMADEFDIEAMLEAPYKNEVFFKLHFWPDLLAS